MNLTGGSRHRDGCDPGLRRDVFADRMRWPLRGSRGSATVLAATALASSSRESRSRAAERSAQWPGTRSRTVRPAPAAHDDSEPPRVWWPLRTRTRRLGVVASGFQDREGRHIYLRICRCGEACVRVTSGPSTCDEVSCSSARVHSRAVTVASTTIRSVRIGIRDQALWTVRKRRWSWILFVASPAEAGSGGREVVAGHQYVRVVGAEDPFAVGEGLLEQPDRVVASSGTVRNFLACSATGLIAVSCHERC